MILPNYVAGFISQMLTTLMDGPMLQLGFPDAQPVDLQQLLQSHTNGWMFEDMCRKQWCLIF